MNEEVSQTLPCFEKQDFDTAKQAKAAAITADWQRLFWILLQLLVKVSRTASEAAPKMF